MKRTLIIALALVLVFGLTASAIDLGLDHEWGESAKVRADFSLAMLPLSIAYPTDGSPKDVEIGLKIPLAEDAYLMAKNSFDFFPHQPFVNWNTDQFQIGLGVPFEYRNFIVRVELFAKQVWSSNRSFPANLTIQYMF